MAYTGKMEVKLATLAPSSQQKAKFWCDGVDKPPLLRQHPPQQGFFLLPTSGIDFPDASTSLKVIKLLLGLGIAFLFFPLFSWATSSSKLAILTACDASVCS